MFFICCLILEHYLIPYYQIEIYTVSQKRPNMYVAKLLHRYRIHEFHEFFHQLPTENISKSIPRKPNLVGQWQIYSHMLDLPPGPQDPIVTDMTFFGIGEIPY